MSDKLRTADIYDFPDKPQPSPIQRQVESGGGGPYDPEMEARVAVLEQIAKSTEEQLRQIREGLKEIRDEQRSTRDRGDRDFRIMFGAIITATLGLAALVAKVGHWI